MSQEKMNSLALLYIESEIMNTINYDDIINDFAIKKARKKMYILIFISLRSFLMTRSNFI